MQKNIDKRTNVYYNKNIRKERLFYEVIYMKIEKVKEMIKNIIALFIIIIVFKTLLSYQLAKSDFKTYDYMVKKNDTLWIIASRICDENEELNIKNVIIDITDINNIENSTIYSGQVIKLPIYNNI